MERKRDWIDNHYTKRLYARTWQKDLKPKSSKVQDIVIWAEKSKIVEYHICAYSKRSLDDEQAHNADKVQEIYLIMMETPQEKWDNLYEQGISQLKAYVIGMIRNQIYSDKSSLYIKYNRYDKMELKSDNLFWEGYCDEN